MDRFDEFLEKITIDMKRRKIKRIDIANKTGITPTAITNCLNGKTLTASTLRAIIEYVDNPENWKK